MTQHEIAQTTRRRAPRIVYQDSMLGDSIELKAKAPARKHHSFKNSTRVSRFLHLGAGVQSSTLAEMMVVGELEAVDVVVFDDTCEEPAWVYQQVDYLEQRLASVDIPLVRVKASEGGLIADTMAPYRRFAAMPLWTINDQGKKGRLKRQCTSEYKIAPSDSTILAWLLDHGYATLSHDKLGRSRRTVKRSIYVESLFGISYDEVGRAGNRGAAWQKALYPLINPLRMTRQHCELWLLEHGLPIPKKSSCIVCPYHDDNYWLDLYISERTAFDRACWFDDWLRSPDGMRRQRLQQKTYLHHSCIPLREVDFVALVDISKRGGANNRNVRRPLHDIAAI